MYLAVIIIVVLVLAAIFLKLKSGNVNTEDGYFPYEKHYLLTKNEWYFYKKLKPIADNLGYSILAKIRLADLVGVKAQVDKKERAKYFARIKAKHIDFVLCNPENLAPILLIELDDNSHNSDKRAERDRFVNTLLEKTGYQLLRTRGTNDLESEIRVILAQPVPHTQEDKNLAK